MSFFFPLQELPNNYLHLRLNVRAMRVGRRGHDKARHISKERLPHSASEHLKHMCRILNMGSLLCQSQKLQRGKVTVFKGLLSGWSHFRCHLEAGRAYTINKPVSPVAGMTGGIAT